MNRKQRIIVSVVGIFIVLLTLVGITYGYFLTRIQGNTNTTSITVTTADLKLTYGDGNGKIEPVGLIEPGFNQTKTFTVKNDGNAIVSYSIIFEDVDNNFERVEDWEYILRKDGVSDPVATGTINRLEVQTILANIEIAVGVTDSYTLEVTYKETNTDQSVDMNKHLGLLVNIIEASAWDKAGNGTLLNAIKTNNELTAPVTMPGKTPSGLRYSEEIATETKTLATSSSTTTTADNWWTYATDYEYDNESGVFILTGLTTCLYSECYEMLSNNHYYLASSVPRNVSSKDNIQKEYNNLTSIYKIENATIDYLTTREIKINTTEVEESTLSTTMDDHGISYYYRGNVTNNYVTFSGMCWKILRVTGDGGIKLVLADREHTCQDGYDPASTDSMFILDGFKGIKYIDKALGDESDFIYENNYTDNTLKAWLNGGSYTYEDPSQFPYSIVTDTFTKKINDDMLMTSDWCIDTSISEIVYYDEDLNIVDTPTESMDYNYGAYSRLYNRTTAMPNLKCDFTGVNNSKSTVYKSKIGILSADEVVFAGSVYSDTAVAFKNFLNGNFGTSIYTLTPYQLIVDYKESYIFIISTYGILGKYDLVNTTNKAKTLRPSIVLKNKVKATFDSNSEYEIGTYQNPYIINEN